MRNRYNRSVKKQKQWLGLVALVLLAVCLLFYKLGKVPSGLAWDEAAIAYDGYSIWHVYRDQWLVKLPISFKSFGDYKAPLAIYADGAFTYLFGISSWSVRLPFAVSGVVAVVVCYWLINNWLAWSELVKDKKKRDQLALLASCVFLTTPWFFHFARAAFESGLSLTLTMMAVASYFQAQLVTHKRMKTIWLLFSALVFALTLYTYHSSKLVTPLLILVFGIISRKNWLADKLNYGVYILSFVLASLPFLKDALFGSGLTRAGVNVISLYGFSGGIIQLIQNYLLHFSPGFLILGEVTTLRHGDGHFGVLLITTFILCLLGLWQFFTQNKQKWSKGFKVALFWILIGLLPAALGEDVPHSNRALQALPGFIMLATWGTKYILTMRKKMFVGFALIHLCLASLYFYRYFTVYAAESSDAFQDGYQQAINLAESYINGEGYEPVSKVYFSNQFGQAYIYALLYKEVTPYEFHNGVLSMYEFKDNLNIGDFQRQNALLVATNKDTDFLPERADHVIYGSDGSVRFMIYRTP